MTKKAPGANPSHRAEKPRPRIAQTATWKLEDAKAKFSEVVRRAHDQGPQFVTVRGKPSVAVIDIAELARFIPKPPAAVALVDFLESLHLDTLNLSRDRDLGRDLAL